jgi:hypothetical protein
VLCGRKVQVNPSHILIQLFASSTSEQQEFLSMGERKVINKYYPPDFDPALVPKRKRPKNEQVKVRMMMPMSVR